MYQPIVPILEDALHKSSTNQIVDLGSGGGGGLLWLNSELKKTIPDLKIVLTDLFPSSSAFEYTKKQANNFEFVEAPVDACHVPKELTGFRTMFLSFHHFKPSQAKEILQNAVDSQSPIGIFEAQERNIPSLLAMLFSPLTVLFTTPFIRPFRISRIVFTYLIPIVPLFVLWDGIVSSFRTYSVPEMKKLIDELDRRDHFDWQVNRTKSGPGHLLYLIGIKK